MNDEIPTFLPLLVPVEGHVLVCNGCGSLVLDNVNALSAHRWWHVAPKTEERVVTETQCPVCSATQPDGLLCHNDTSKLEQALGDVRWIVTELDVTLSKQARIGTPGKGGLAREKNPIHLGALEAADTLGNVLTTWERDVCPALLPPRPQSIAIVPVIAAAKRLLLHIDAIRRHPAVGELLDEILDAIEQARRAVDRPADRMYLGTCSTVLPDDEGDDVECVAEIWARVDAHEAVCRVCGITHEVAERRAWLLLRAADMLTTVKEASRYIGDVGGIAVTEASIRGLIHRRRLAYRAGTTTFRLGDLLEVLTDMRAKEAAA